MTLKKIANYQDFFIDYQASLKEVIAKMNINGNGSVVLIKNSFPLAMLTQSDIINALGERSDLSENIYEYATQDIISVDENSPIEFAIKLFSKHNIRRIILINREEQFCGVVLQERLFNYLGEDIDKFKMEQEVERRIEKEYFLMQQSKLATMGEMIGHIAHQWRQPLAELGGVFMNLDSAYEFGELDGKYLKEKVKNGNELIKYMSNTIDDFRNFFVPNRDKEFFELSKYIQSAVNIIEATLTYHHIKLEIIATNEPIYILGYPSEFSQVILNLLNNAKDVLVERDIAYPKIRVESRHVDDEVIISVWDNGGGVDEEIMAEIFDIYFSTKMNKGGTGLGLYMSKLIIETKLLGKITVSNSNDGAKFLIILKDKSKK